MPQHTRNTRPIFPDSFRFIRSDVPTIVTEEEAIWLIDHNDHDYMKSKDNLKEILNAYALQNPEIDINIITPNEKYIKDFLHWYDGK